MFVFEKRNIADRFRNEPFKKAGIHKKRFTKIKESISLSYIKLI